MSKVWLEAVLEELLRVRGLDLSDYRRATLERRLVRRPGDRHAFYADTGVPLLVEEMVNHGARRDRLQATVAGGAMGSGGAMRSPPGKFGDLGRLNVEAVTGRFQEMGIPMVIREVLGQMGRRIS
ncbi:MAG: hypothetical protein ABIG94_04155 [Pseudomonadota bacterium]